MEPITALLYCYRLPNLSPLEFRNYCEEKHVPLTKSLLGADYPLSHKRYYINKESGYAMGSPTPTDPDLIAVITYSNQVAMQQSMALRQSDGIREQIQADEDKFMDRSKIRLIVLGQADIGETAKEV